MKSPSLYPFYAILFSLFILSFPTPAKCQNLDWVNSFGSSGSDGVSSVKTDISGNVYITGWFRNTVDFDPGSGVVSLTASSGSSDVFIVKYDNGGNLIWVRQVGGMGNDSGAALHLDADDNIYIAGTMNSNFIDLNPGTGTNTYINAGNRDAFIIKLNSAGNFLWGHGFGGNGNENIYQIATDTTGNLWFTGSFENTVDFDPGAGTSNLTASAFRDGMIVRLDENGDFLSAQSIGGGVNNDEGRSLLADDFGNVYAAGRFSGTVDFDPSAGTTNVTSSGTSDGYIAKFNGNGSLIWVKILEGDNITWAVSMAFDSNGELYVNGRTTSTSVDYDPGVGTEILSGDRFLLKLDTAGTFIWATTIQTQSSSISPNFLATDNQGNVYLVGDFEGTIDFDPGPANQNITSVAKDVYIWKLTSSGDYEWAISIGGTGDDIATSVNIDPNGDISIAGYYENDIDFDPGSGSVTETSLGFDDGFVLNLNQCDNITGTDVQTSCGNYTWIDGNTYTSNNNTATFNIVGGAQNGCDSLVTLDLTIINAATGTDTRTECNSYTWIDGNTYTSNNNTATFNIVGGAANGCDSLVTLDLTINNVSDLTTSVSGVNISANNSLATYQWLDCDDNYAVISSETGQTFTPTSNGNYAVELTENGCIDTSSCVNITSVGILENNFGAEVVVYPNPTHGNFSVDLGQKHESLVISITDIQGRLIQSTEYNNAQFLNLNITEPSGIYIMTITSKDQRAVIRLVKE